MATGRECLLFPEGTPDSVVCIIPSDNALRRISYVVLVAVNIVLFTIVCIFEMSVRSGIRLCRGLLYGFSPFPSEASEMLQ